MAMKFRTFRRAAFARVTVEGRIESYHLSTVRESVARLVDRGYSNVILDLTSASTTMDESFLASLAPLFVPPSMRSGVTVVVAPSEEFRTFLARTGLESSCDIVTDRARALPCLLARMRKRYDQSFFRLLLDRNILDKETLKSIVEEYRSRDEKKPFGDLLVERGYVSIENLLDLLATSMRNAPANLDSDDLGTEALAGLVDESPGTGGDLAGGTGGHPDHSVRSVSSERGAAESAGDREGSPPSWSEELFEELAVDDSPSDHTEATDRTPRTSGSEFVTRSLFGEILVENGLITERELRRALEIQRARNDGMRLGDILLEQGFIDDHGVFDALQSQVRRRSDFFPPAVEADGAGEDCTGTASSRPGAARQGTSEFIRPGLFGEILLELGLVDESQLRIALDTQRSHPERQLGEILVEMNAVTPQQILQALEEQANRKGSA